MPDLFETAQNSPGEKCIYLIHFSFFRAHARHYLGSSRGLMARLAAHANGRGSRITRALWEDGEDWQLAALYVPRNPQADIRQIEANAKKRHSGGDYCPLCHADCVAPKGTISYPVLKLGISSHTLRRQNHE